jgi:hypothetical protein
VQRSRGAVSVVASRIRRWRVFGVVLFGAVVMLAALPISAAQASRPGPSTRPSKVSDGTASASQARSAHSRKAGRRSHERGRHADARRCVHKNRPASNHHRKADRSRRHDKRVITFRHKHRGKRRSIDVTIVVRARGVRTVVVTVRRPHSSVTTLRKLRTGSLAAPVRTVPFAHTAHIRTARATSTRYARARPLRTVGGVGRRTNAPQVPPRTDEDQAATEPIGRVEGESANAARSAPPSIPTSPAPAQWLPSKPRAAVAAPPASAAQHADPTPVADRPIDGAEASTALLVFAVIGLTALGVIGIVLSAGHRGRS